MDVFLAVDHRYQMGEVGHRAASAHHAEDVSVGVGQQEISQVGPDHAGNKAARLHCLNLSQQDGQGLMSTSISRGT
jgi:hypothetical protein